MLVKYIGKGNKHDSIHGVGLHWKPGQSHDVTAEVAQRLIHFSDTWVMDDSKVDTHATHTHVNTPVEDEPIGLKHEDKPLEEPLPVVDVHSMSRDDMAEYAMKQYNEKLDKRETLETLRHKLVALISKHEHDKHEEGKK